MRSLRSRLGREAFKPFLRMSFKRLVLLVLGCWPAFGFAAEENTRRVTFSCWVSPDLPLYERLNDYFAQSFAAIGYDFSMVHQPPMRATASSLRGSVDGECVRVDRYLDLVPGLPLLRLEVEIAQTELSVWSHNPGMRVSAQTDLSAIAEKTAYISGTAVMRMIADPETLARMKAVGGADQGLKMLAAKRVDWLIAPQAMIDEEFSRQDYGDQVHYVGTLMTLHAYPYIHRRHQSIAPALAEELRKRLPPGGFALN